jgi:hypothetical protein
MQWVAGQEGQMCLARHIFGGVSFDINLVCTGELCDQCWLVVWFVAEVLVRDLLEVWWVWAV